MPSPRQDGTTGAQSFKSLEGLCNNPLLPRNGADSLLQFTGMAAAMGLSTPEYREAFAILDRFWTSHRLGAEAGGF